MMRTTLTIAAAFLLAVTAIAQDSKPATLDMKPAWKKGDKILLNRTKEKYIPQQGKFILQSRGMSKIAIEILDKTEKSSKISWITSGKKSQIQGDKLTQMLIAKLGSLTDGARVIFETDEKGRPNKLLNAEEIAKFYQGVVASLDTWMEENKIPDQTRQGIRQNLLPFTKTETLPFVAMKDPMLYFARVDVVPLGAPVVTDIELPNPTDASGENPLPGKSSLQLVRVKHGHHYVEFKQSLDDEKTKQVLLKTMQERAIATGQPLPTLAQVPRFSLQNTVRMRYDAKTGVPFEITSVEASAMGANGLVSTASFVRTDMPDPERNVQNKPAAPGAKPTSQPTKDG